MGDHGERGWREIGGVAPEALVQPRLQLHWAAQTVSAVAASLLEARADDSHRSLEWCGRHDALATLTLPQGHRAGLRLSDLILFLEKDGEIEESFPLDGHTLEDGFGWWRGQCEAMNAVLQHPLTTAEWDMPEHATGQGQAFDVSDARSLAEVARYYGNADQVLESVVECEVGAAPVRCWPHHFDIATLITFDADAPADAARSIGVGFSPGDDSYGEPYFYANPWPRPTASTAPPLPSGGGWHREGWFGAVLTASQVVSKGDAGSGGGSRPSWQPQSRPTRSCSASSRSVAVSTMTA